MKKNFCSKCGNELLPDSSFCMRCGTRVTSEEYQDGADDRQSECIATDREDTDSDEHDDGYDDNSMDECDESGDYGSTDDEYNDGYDDAMVEYDNGNRGNRVIHREIDDGLYEDSEKKTSDNAIVAWFLNLDLFCKAAAVMIALFTVIGIISAFTDYTLVTVISFIQVAGVVTALLMHKNIIKIDSKYGFVKYLILLAMVLLMMVSIKSCSSGADDDIMDSSDSLKGMQSETIPEDTDIPSVTSAQENTPVPTNTPAPTNTPTPTSTPVPTNTPTPTAVPASAAPVSTGKTEIARRNVYFRNIMFKAYADSNVQYLDDGMSVLCATSSEAVTACLMNGKSYSDEKFGNSQSELEQSIIKIVFGDRDDYARTGSSGYRNVAGRKCYESMYQAEGMEFRCCAMNMPETGEVYVLVLAKMSSASDIREEYESFLSSVVLKPEGSGRLIDTGDNIVLLDITSEMNLIFAKYDIDVYLGNTGIFRISNGDSGSRYLTVPDGNYDLTFVAADSSGSRATKSIYIGSDCKVSCSLKSHEDSIDVNKFSQGAGVSNELFGMPNVRHKFLSAGISDMNYRGISNISYKGSDDSVTVNGDNSEWYITGQSVMEDTLIGRNDSVELTVCKIADLMNELFTGVDAYEAKAIGTREGFYVQFVKALSGAAFDTQLKSEEELHKWVVKTIASKSASSTAVTIGLVYTGKVTMPKVVKMEPSEAVACLNENGFSNIVLKSEDGREVTGANWIVTAQSVKKGKEVNANKEIVLTCEKTVPDPTPTPSPTPTPMGIKVNYHSSGYYTIAQEGNSGVYAYVRKGSEYNIYQIIDFDEGYVYYIQNPGSSSCDKVKIVSGDLNTRIKITYHDGDTWSEYLYFKWKNRPDNLIWADSDGFEYGYTPTDLNEALRIRDTKTIIENKP